MCAYVLFKCAKNTLKNILKNTRPFIAACRSLIDIVAMVKVVEQALHAHFHALPTPAHDTLNLPQDVIGYGWHSVTACLSLPQAKMDDICQSSIAEAASLLLHGHLLQSLPGCSTLLEEFRIAAKVTQWCTQMKPR